MTYKIKYKNGMRNDRIVEANSEDEAKRLGLAYHRANYGFVETVDLWPMEKVVESVELID